MLKSFVQTVRPVYEVLTGAQSQLLVTIRESCRPDNLDPTIKLISEVINEDVTYQKAPLDLRNQRTYAVKVVFLVGTSFLSLTSIQSGVSGLLDVARQTFKEATEDVHQHIADINSMLSHEFSALRMSTDISRPI